MSEKNLKKQIYDLITTTHDAHFEGQWRSFQVAHSLRKIVNPLFSLFYNGDRGIKMRAVTAMGITVATLAETDKESARVIMRRLMWNLNDESGGIGWGSPEALGEIMARHGGLAEEYHNILFSYCMDEGNFLEHPELQKGVLWGIARLAQTRPQRVRDVKRTALLHPYMDSPDPETRGLAAWALRTFPGTSETVERLKKLIEDDAPLELYRESGTVTTTVGKLARESLSHIERT